VTAPIVVFYAYKGGTGRTTTLALVAWALARQGRRVVVMDFDLTAPGLGPLFGTPPETRGIVDLAREWPRDRRCAVLDAYWEVPLDAQATGNLFVITAGRVDAEYLAALQAFDWQDLVTPKAMQGDLFDAKRSFLDALRDAVRADLRPDVILVDAPTGFSDTANVVLDVLADAAVLCFAPNRIQLEGIGRVAHMLVRAVCERREAGEAPRPDVLCVASMLMSRRLGSAEMKRVKTAFDYLREVRYDAFGRSRQLDEQTLEIVEQEPCVVGYEGALSDLDGLSTERPIEPDALAAVSEVIPFVRDRIPARDSEARSSAPFAATSGWRC
jgi:cellulose biosynthesis protein BcsQ